MDNNVANKQFNETVLITGAAGMVGRAYIDYLRNLNLEGLNIIGTYYKKQPADFHSNVKYEKINLLISEEVNELISRTQPNKIIHLAAQSMVRLSWENPRETINDNFKMLLNILDGIRILKLNIKILVVGSGEIYGGDLMLGSYFKETDVLLPENPYAFSRLIQEDLSDFYGRIYNIPIVKIRSFNHIDQNQSEHFFIPSIIKQIVKAKLLGEQELKLQVGNINVYRDFLHVKDVVRAYHQLIEFGNPGEVYNVCSNNAISLKQIIEFLGEISGLKVILDIQDSLIRPKDPKYLVGDNQKLKNTINWNPFYSIEEILKEIYLYYLRNS